MTFDLAKLIAKSTKTSTIKEVNYISTIFKQTPFITADGDLDVVDQEFDVTLKMDIPVHTFESFIDVLVELRKDFDVGCAYSKEPINSPINNDSIVSANNYTFAYWNSAHNNVLFSDYSKQFNVFIYLNEFGRFANLYIIRRNN